MTDLAGKVAIVTGGSRGIGAGTAFVRSTALLVGPGLRKKAQLTTTSASDRV